MSYPACSVDKSYIDAKDTNEGTALLMATERAYFKTIKVLSDYGAGEFEDQGRSQAIQWVGSLHT